MNVYDPIWLACMYENALNILASYSLIVYDCIDENRIGFTKQIKNKIKFLFDSYYFVSYQIKYKTNPYSLLFIYYVFQIF